MAKKIKFPLVMKDDAEARTMEEFKEHFDIEKAVGYFLDGKLLSWLEARYYDTEADAVRALDKNDAELRKKLCGIFGAEYNEEEIVSLDVEEAEERSRKLSKLRQYTSDQVILDKVDSVAFDQEDLADLLDNDVHDIYLCNNSFVIPLRVEDKKYIGIGKAEAVIKSEEWVDFAAKKIVFEGVEFDAKYAKVYQESSEGLYQLGCSYHKKSVYDKAFYYYQQAADKENVDAMRSIGYCYENGQGVPSDPQKAFQWYKKAASLDNAEAMYSLYRCYDRGIGVEKNCSLAKEWLQKSADKGLDGAMNILGRNYIQGNDGFETNYALGMQWLNKAASTGNISTMIEIGDIYAGNTYYETSFTKDSLTALMWYKKAMEALKTKLNEDYLEDILTPISKLYANFGVGKDEYMEALKIAKQLAASGDVAFMYYLGKLYEEGNGCENDLDQALAWYKKALDNGYDWLTDSIGKIYDEKGDYPKAIDWYEKYIAQNEGVEDTLKDMRIERVKELRNWLNNH